MKKSINLFIRINTICNSLLRAVMRREFTAKSLIDFKFLLTTARSAPFGLTILVIGYTVTGIPCAVFVAIMKIMK